MTMKTTAISRAEETPAALLEKVVVGGDLSKLTASERMDYYKRVCESVGLNPLTRPFDYLVLDDNKTTLYARKDATDQLRALKAVSLEITGRERVEDVFVVTARATTPEGRTDESTGAVWIAGLKGNALANALMKAETKAKRRVTLSICGLGWLDETEIETIPGAQTASSDAAFDLESGEVLTGAEKVRRKVRETLITRCREAGITLGKERVKPIARGRIPEKLDDVELAALADDLEAAVEAMKLETGGDEPVEAAEYEPGGEA